MGTNRFSSRIIGKSITSAIALSLLASSASALTVTESVDFSNTTGSAANIGTLDLGTNTISGSVAGRSGVGDFEDNFLLTLLPGTTISSASLAITNFSYGGGDITIRGSFATYNFSPGFGTTGNGTFPLGPYATSGDFLMSIGTPSSFRIQSFNDQLVQTPFSGNLSYTFTFNVQSTTPPTVDVVPLPAAFPSALSVLGLLALTRLRKRTRA